MDEERYTNQDNSDQAGEDSLTDKGTEEGAPEQSISELQVQLAELNDKYLRAYAEIDNMKKRMERERQEIIKYGKENLLKDFLLVYDAIEKSIMAAREHFPDDEAFIEGLQMTERMLLETLKRNHVEPIETQGMSFDPNYHEAMMQINRDDLGSGMVVDEIEKGFMLHERVLRPAKVTVSA